MRPPSSKMASPALTEQTTRWHTVSAGRATTEHHTNIRTGRAAASPLGSSLGGRTLRTRAVTGRIGLGAAKLGAIGKREAQRNAAETLGAMPLGTILMVLVIPVTPVATPPGTTSGVARITPAPPATTHGHQPQPTSPEATPRRRPTLKPPQPTAVIRATTNHLPHPPRTNPSRAPASRPLLQPPAPPTAICIKNPGKGTGGAATGGGRSRRPWTHSTRPCPSSPGSTSSSGPTRSTTRCARRRPGRRRTSPHASLGRNRRRNRQGSRRRSRCYTGRCRSHRNCHGNPLPSRSPVSRTQQGASHLETNLATPSTRIGKKSEKGLGPEKSPEMACQPLKSPEQ